MFVNTLRLVFVLAVTLLLFTGPLSVGYARAGGSCCGTPDKAGAQANKVMNGESGSLRAEQPASRSCGLAKPGDDAGSEDFIMQTYSSREPKIGDCVACPVTGLKLTVSDKSPSIAINGKRYYCCSNECASTLKKEPDKYKYVFRTCLNAKYLVSYLVGIMSFAIEEFGFNKVYIMYQDVAWARATAGGMVKNYFEKAGWTVVGQESYPTGASDFSSGLMKVRAGGAQVILPIFDMPQSGILVKQWNAMRVPALLAGFISPLAGPGAWKTFDQKIGGAVNCNFELGSAIASQKVPESVDFYYAYEKKYGKPMEAGHGPAPTYESVYILKEAIERAGSLDPDAIVAEIKKTDRRGVMGRIQFDEGHQAIFGMDPDKAAVACVFQWSEQGDRINVFPEAIADGKIKLPTGLKSAK